jgi:endonuclease YncB( thermonuclease family)
VGKILFQSTYKNGLFDLLRRGPWVQVPGGSPLKMKRLSPSREWIGALLAFAEKTTVVGVLDGDTIEVLHNNRAERIRLNGIDRP